MMVHISGIQNADDFQYPKGQMLQKHHHATFPVSICLLSQHNLLEEMFL